MKRFKLLRYIFIPFICFVLMSHNTFAVDVSLNATPIWSNYDATLCVNVITVGTTCNANGYLNTSSSATNSIGWISFSLPQGLNITANKTVAVYTVVLDNFATNDSIDGVFLNPRVQSAYPVSWGLLNVKTFSQGSGSYRVEFTLLAEGSGTVASDRTITISSVYNNTELAFLKPNERISGAMASYYNLEGSGTDEIVNAINNSSDSGAINNAKDEIVNAIEEQQQKEEEAVENIENQDQPDVGDNSASSSILNNALNIFNTIVNTSKSTGCSVPANWGNLNLGDINFCVGRENFIWVVNFVSSISVVVIVIGSSIILVKQIINLYDWARK